MRTLADKRALFGIQISVLLALINTNWKLQDERIVPLSVASIEAFDTLYIQHSVIE